MRKNVVFIPNDFDLTLVTGQLSDNHVFTRKLIPCLKMTFKFVALNNRADHFSIIYVKKLSI